MDQTNQVVPIVRPAAVAGSFYPADPVELRGMVDDLLAKARATVSPSARAPKAIIVPHAGYVYSGPTAALAYAAVERLRGTVTRAVVIGPTHRIPVRGVALPGADYFETPLGRVHVPEDWALRALRGLPYVGEFPPTHAGEHAVEVQLPFLQRALGTIEAIPLNAGDASPGEVADVIEALWGGPETLIVISSDLSHYHPYDEAKALDAQTIERIEACRVPIRHDRACGATGVNGMLTVCRRRSLHPRLLGAANSGDTLGGREQVVGYSAFAIEEG